MFHTKCVDMFHGLPRYKPSYALLEVRCRYETESLAYISRGSHVL